VSTVSPPITTKEVISPSVSSEAEYPGSVYVEYKFTSMDVLPTSVIIGEVRSSSSLSQLTKSNINIGRVNKI
jgi:hypothetical protein